MGTDTCGAVAAGPPSANKARHSELSAISSLDDSPGSPTRETVEVALAAGMRALDVDLAHLHERSASAAQFISVHPGEHYRFLAALTERLEPSLVVEIGTFTGLSALAILSKLPPAARLISYDLVRWDMFDDSALRVSDFEDGRLEQRLGDLAEQTYFDHNVTLLESASMIFVDGPKDGHFEPQFMRLISSLPRRQACWLIFDDIRLWKMLGFWRSIGLPKFDATSVGHWSGTGICLLSATQ